MNKTKLKCLKDCRMSIENMENLGNCWSCDEQEQCRGRLTRIEQLNGAVRLADSVLKHAHHTQPFAHGKFKEGLRK